MPSLSVTEMSPKELPVKVNLNISDALPVEGIDELNTTIIINTASGSEYNKSDNNLEDNVKNAIENTQKISGNNTKLRAIILKFINQYLNC